MKSEFSNAGTPSDAFTHNLAKCTVRAASLLLGFCWVLVGNLTLLHGTESKKPNIIMILADDLGYGDLSCFGQENFQTPRLDRMAADGMRLTSHYAGSTVCAPSRACLMTGQHTGHVFQRYNGNVEFRADPQDITVARILKNAGYQTGLIGKSGLSCNSENGSLPNEKGFDYFFGFTSHGRAHRYYPDWLWKNGEKVEYPKNELREGDTYSSDVFLEESLRFLDDHAAGPFFLHISLQQPHADLNVPQQWKEPYFGKFDEEPYLGNSYRKEMRPKSTFAGMVAHLDNAVGQVLDKLNDLGIADNTLVIFSSDNGAMSEGGWSRTYFDSSGPLRGGKRDLYEGGIRVPTIAWWPGRIQPGTSSDHMSAFWDFLPTACEVANITPPEGIDGISYLPTLLGKTQPKHNYLYWEFYEQGGKQAVRTGQWKGVRLAVGENPNGPIELYNLENDLGESDNVAADHPEIVTQIENLMTEAHQPSEVVSFTGTRSAKASKKKARKQK